MVQPTRPVATRFVRPNLPRENVNALTTQINALQADLTRRVASLANTQLDLLVKQTDPSAVNRLFGLTPNGWVSKLDGLRARRDGAVATLEAHPADAKALVELRSATTEFAKEVHLLGAETLTDISAIGDLRRARSLADDRHLIATGRIAEGVMKTEVQGQAKIYQRSKEELFDFVDAELRFDPANPDYGARHRQLQPLLAQMNARQGDLDEFNLGRSGNDIASLLVQIGELRRPNQVLAQARVNTLLFEAPKLPSSYPY